MSHLDLWMRNKVDKIHKLEIENEKTIIFKYPFLLLLAL